MFKVPGSNSRLLWVAESINVGSESAEYNELKTNATNVIIAVYVFQAASECLKQAIWRTLNNDSKYFH